MEDWKNAGFGIYVHWPFCSAKCPYCDFNSHVRQSIDHDRWLASYLSELENEAKRTAGRQVDTIFFGGGTPSLMDPDTVRGIIEKIAQLWTLSPKAEITLEANPTSVEAGKFRAFAQAGVNRLSLGIQSLKDKGLKELGRMHSAKEARTAFDIAKDCFQRVSFDLIYARQNQSLQDWRSELSEATSMAVDHLSMYQLTIEKGTRFGDLYNRGMLLGLPTDKASAKMYEVTQEMTFASGLGAYEVSNHARKGSESQHNLIYWRYGDYIGVGPGAHGRITLANGKVATKSTLLPELWLEDVSALGTSIIDEEVISSNDQASEYLMMSLRLTEGTSISRFESLAGATLNSSAILQNSEMGFLSVNGDSLKATPKGRIILNTLLKDLLT